LIGEVGALTRFAHLGRDQQAMTCCAGDQRRLPHALVRRHPTEKKQVAPVAVTNGELVRVDPWWMTRSILTSEPGRPDCGRSPTTGSRSP
jgi:hypothetical protein